MSSMKSARRRNISDLQSCRINLVDTTTLLRYLTHIGSKDSGKARSMYIHVTTCRNNYMYVLRCALGIDLYVS